MTRRATSLFDTKIAGRAVLESFRKLDPRAMIKNPVMFVVEVVSLLTTGLWIQALVGHGEAPAPFILAVSLTLWFTILFANFAEAMAEGRGKAQAEALRKTRQDTLAMKLPCPRRDAPFVMTASGELRKFARAHGIPVAHTFMAKGSMPYDDELCLLSVGLQARDYISCGFDKADLIIAIGYDPVEYAPKFWNPERKKSIVHIDFTPAEVDSFYQPAVEVVADVREAIQLLGGLVKGQKDPEPFRRLRQFILAELAEGADDDRFPLKPQRILKELRDRMGREDILVSDVGTHKLWIARTFPAYEPNTVLISNGYAAMGFALPAAIAAKLVHPERNVVAVSGDGGFLMNSQELETACRLRLPIVNVIFRDGGYNLIQWKQQTHLGRESGVKFGNPDFVALAAAFGAKGYRVDSAQALGPILAEALAQPGPSIVDVPVDYQNPKLTAGLGQLICPI